MTVLDACPNHETMQWLSGADASFVYYENDCLNSAYACSNKFYASISLVRPCSAIACRLSRFMPASMERCVFD